MKARALLTNLAEADLRLLQIFVAIAESGGLAAAELRLNIGRSVISRHLKDLRAEWHGISWHVCASAIAIVSWRSMCTALARMTGPAGDH